MLQRLGLGFLAGVLAVLLCHDPMVMLLNSLGWVPFKAYNMDAVKTAPTWLASLMAQAGFKGWPILFNGMFWGGLWGALFSVVHSWLPGRMMLFGLIVMLLSNWLVLPMIRGTAMFAGLVPLRMLSSVLILGAFGAGIGLFYGLFRRR
jgi:hypothetical protein